jgi:hypothetical protein
MNAAPLRVAVLQWDETGDFLRLAGHPMTIDTRRSEGKPMRKAERKKPPGLRLAA